MKMISVLYTVLILRSYASNRFGIFTKNGNGNETGKISNKETTTNKANMAANKPRDRSKETENGREYTMEDMLEELEKDYPQVGGNGVILDLSGTQNDNVETISHNYTGVAYKRFVPKEGVYIKSVVDAGSKVWNAAEGEECIFVTLSSDKNMLFVTINLQTNGKVKQLRFKRVGNVWKNITKNWMHGNKFRHESEKQ